MLETLCTENTELNTNETSTNTNPTSRTERVTYTLLFWIIDKTQSISNTDVVTASKANLLNSKNSDVIGKKNTGIRNAKSTGTKFKRVSIRFNFLTGNVVVMGFLVIHYYPEHKREGHYAN